MEEHVNGTMVPTYVPMRYCALSGPGARHPGSEFAINDCSLIEYIGVEWCSRIPEREHLRYVTGVFLTLADAGNDAAAKKALQLLFEVYMGSEFETRFIVRSYAQGGYGKFVKELVYGRCKAIADEIRTELKHEFLEFIRKRFWAMPVSFDTPASVLRDALTGPHLALMETRKEMVRAVVGLWRGTPYDANDELAWAILCGMVYPGIDVCDNTARGISNKHINDHLVEQLRLHLRNNIEWAKMAGQVVAMSHDRTWEHWIDLSMSGQTPNIMREVLAKTRTAVIGWEGTLADIRARRATDPAMLPIEIELDLGENDFSSDAAQADAQTR